MEKPFVTPKKGVLISIVMLLISSTMMFSQSLGDPANFSIRGDLYSGTTTTLSDDWFQGLSGFGMIDQTNTATFTTWTANKSNTPFTAGQAYPQYELKNGSILYDAIYARDYINMLSTANNDLTAFIGGVKNGDDPSVDWGVIPTNVGGSVDLVDIYAHMRREGTTVGANLWLNMGVSTLDNTGEHFVDFELFANPIEVSGSTFINSGDDEGHTAWLFDGTGKITASGDLVAGFSFNGTTVSNIEVRIWTARANWGTDGTDGLVINPVGFTWGPEFDGEGNGSIYGYAQIIIPLGAKFSTGISSSVTGPPWGTFNDGGPAVTSIYEPGYFVEVGIDLSALGIDPSLRTDNACDAAFQKILVKSRSSASFSSQLKDFAGPYAFLGAPVVPTAIKPTPEYFTCETTQITLAPLTPYAGNYYYNWSTIDGTIEGAVWVDDYQAVDPDADPIVYEGAWVLFYENTDGTFNDSATITSPGTFRLTSAPLAGCTENYSEIIIYAAPCAIDDHMGEVVESGTIIDTVTYNVLDNTDGTTDYDLDHANSTLILTEYTAPSNGSITIDAIHGNITYTPNPGYFGIDTFEYQICDSTPIGVVTDGGPLCDTATVTVIVLEDVDDDGVGNIYDLDNDNDGIPDSIELQCNSVPNPNLIIDGDFEDINIVTTIIPGINSILDNTVYDLIGIASYTSIWRGDVDYIPGWQSLDGDSDGVKHFEIWQEPNTQPDYTNGHGAYSGIQWVELEARPSSQGYYQDFNTTGGEVLRWSFAHRKRVLSGPDDVVTVVIGEGGDPHSLTTADIQATYTTVPNNEWTEHHGFYTVPVGQTTTRFWLTDLIAYGGTGRNFIDKVEVNVFDNCYDADADGIPNYLDLDSDNDGIPDVLEAGLTDSDNDGLVDTISYGTNGLADNVETSDDKFADINYTIPNTDAASDSNPDFTLYNFLDVDSDNDGITDTTEAFQINGTYNDEDNGGEIDLFVDADDNGWHDVIDAEGTFPEILNSDSDALPNYLDLDSDGDGLPDTFEGNFQVLDGENDGIVGTGIPVDTDGDGLADSNDPDALALYDEDNNGLHDILVDGFGFNQDRDGDGVKNYLDIDIDNDGIIDNIEGQPTFSHRLPTGNDDDNDGIDNAYDVDIDPTYGIGYTNTDGGSAPDYADDDSENDLIFDILENNISNNLDDSNADGILDTFTDADGDGLADVFDLIDNTDIAISPTANATNGSQTPFTHPDTSNLVDGIYVDDGDRDWRENSDQDNDNDGIPDVVDLDDDNDGILDTVEDLDLDNDGDPRTNPTDTDGDGIPNYFDLDSDGDGLTDTYEAGGTFDADGSGMPGTDMLLYNLDPAISQVGITGGADYGVPDQYTILYGSYPQNGIIPLDTDGDLIPDYLDLDSDNDGISDVLEAGGIDGNGDGIYGDGAANDVDADGLHDDLDNLFNSHCHIITKIGTYVDTNINGIWDSGDTINYEFTITNIHNQDYLNVSLTDSKLTPSAISGLTELGGGSGNDLAMGATATATGSYTLKAADIAFGSFFNDAEVTFTVSGKVFNATYRDTQSPASTSNTPDCSIGTLNGTPLTTLDTGYHQALDTDGDNIPNHLDLDSDDDTIPDNVEAQTTLGYVAPSGSDSDNSGIDDNYDIHNGTPIVPVDTDEDGIPDYLDLDSDNDLLYDITEAGTDNADADTDGDGMTNNTVGANGFDNNFEQGLIDLGYTDVNGIYDDPENDFPDADADVLYGGDVDYRDAEFSDNDLDGIPDSIDLDDDNDGILDLVEANDSLTDPLLDSDGDGVSDYLDEDFCTLNTHGICESLDNDNDGIPNFFDLDSDNDGCSDALEAGSTTITSDNYQFPTTPVGTDGVPDAVQTDPNGGGGTDGDNLLYAVIETNAGTYDFLDDTINIACKADLSLRKTVSNATPNIGDTITFTLTITNLGPFSVSGIKVEDILDEGLLFQSSNATAGAYDNITGIWDLSDEMVLINETETLTITVKIGPNCGPITNSAEIISSDRSDPDSTPNNQK